MTCFHLCRQGGFKSLVLGITLWSSLWGAAGADLRDGEGAPEVVVEVTRLCAGAEKVYNPVEAQWNLRLWVRVNDGQLLKVTLRAGSAALQESLEVLLAQEEPGVVCAEGFLHLEATGLVLKTFGLPSPSGRAPNPRPSKQSSGISAGNQ